MPELLIQREWIELNKRVWRRYRCGFAIRSNCGRADYTAYSTNELCSCAVRLPSRCRNLRGSIHTILNRSKVSYVWPCGDEEPTSRLVVLVTTTDVTSAKRSILIVCGIEAAHFGDTLSF